MKRSDSHVIPESGFHTCEAAGTCEPAQYVESGLLCNAIRSAWSHVIYHEPLTYNLLLYQPVLDVSLALSTCVRCVEV